LKKLIAAAEKYEEACETAIKTSGIEDAGRAVRKAARDLLDLVWELQKFPPTTMFGVFIYARAIAACDDAADDTYGRKGHAGFILGRQMAEAIARLAPEAAVA